MVQKFFFPTQFSESFKYSRTNISALIYTEYQYQAHYPIENITGKFRLFTRFVLKGQCHENFVLTENVGF